MAEHRITATRIVSDDLMVQAGEVMQSSEAVSALEKAGFKVEAGIFPKRAPKTPKAPANAATAVVAAGNGANHADTEIV